MNFVVKQQVSHHVVSLVYDFYHQFIIIHCHKVSNTDLHRHTVYCQSFKHLFPPVLWHCSWMTDGRLAC